MFKMLHVAYQTIAVELGHLRIIPVGTAFESALQRSDWHYQPDTKFDFAHAQPPTLPNQQLSLHVGWYWGKDKDGRDHLEFDGHHAGAAGEFLAALVWREYFLGVDVRKNSFKPQELSEVDATILREVAHASVVKRLQPRYLKTK
jgi:hypothetical protein